MVTGVAGFATAPIVSEPLVDDLLRGFRVRRCVCFATELGAPWSLNIATDCAVFHVVAQGSCWLRAKGLTPPLKLSAGEMVVLTSGRAHTVRDRLSTPIVNSIELFKTWELRKDRPTRCGGNGAVTQLLCGGIEFENAASNSLLAILPPLLHIKRANDGARRGLALTTQHILSELSSAAKGAEEVVTRLGGILLMQAVRVHFEENAEIAGCGWLAGIRDQQIARGLAIIHSQPQRPWTVMSLARRLAMSRSTFAARFKELVGEPPHRYIRRLRLDAAAERLRTGPETLSVIAADVGYSSAAAFAKSFKRRVGTTPSEYRDLSVGRWPA